MDFLLECYGSPVAERQAIESVVPALDWHSGTAMSDIGSPIRVTLDGDGEMVPMFNRGILLWSSELLRVVRGTGADNIQDFEVEVVDPVAGTMFRNYRAINIIGMLSVADLQKSDWSAPGGIPLISVDFDSLAIDRQKAKPWMIFRLAECVTGIVVHQLLKTAIEQSGVDGLDFVHPEDWMG